MKVGLLRHQHTERCPPLCRCPRLGRLELQGLSGAWGLGFRVRGLGCLRERGGVDPPHIHIYIYVYIPIVVLTFTSGLRGQMDSLELVGVITEWLYKSLFRGMENRMETLRIEGFGCGDVRLDAKENGGDC